MKTLFLIIVLIISGCINISKDCDCGCISGGECECTQCRGEAPQAEQIRLKP